MGGSSSSTAFPTRIPPNGFRAQKVADVASGRVGIPTKSHERPRTPFYQAGRHTYASHYVMAGGSIEKLKEILGHSTVLVTERYAHLRPDLFSEADRERVAIAL